MYYVKHFISKSQIRKMEELSNEIYSKYQTVK